MSEPVVDMSDELKSIELADIVVQSFEASLNRLAPVEGMQFEVGTSWTANDDNSVLLVRFAARCALFDVKISEAESDNERYDADHRLASLRCTVVGEYDVPAASRAAVRDGDDIRGFLETVAFPAAFPYLREAVSSMSTRLGFPRVTLGTYRRDGGMSFSSRAL